MHSDEEMNEDSSDAEVVETGSEETRFIRSLYTNLGVRGADKGATWKCKGVGCTKQVVGNGVSRLREHLIRTSKGVSQIKLCKGKWPAAVSAQLESIAKRLSEQAADKARAKAREGGIFKATKQTNLSGLKHSLMKEEVHMKVAAFFFIAGIPFNLVRLRVFREMWDAIGRAAGQVNPPAYNTLRTTLLDKVRLLGLRAKEHRWKRKGRVIDQISPCTGAASLQVAPSLQCCSLYVTTCV